MENKHYTPTFSYIVPGLIYETNLEPVIKNGKWVEFEFDENNIMNGIDRLLSKPETMRVKYLDRVDIESFEFIEDEDASPIENVDHMKFEKHRFDNKGRLMNLEFSWMWLNDQPFILLSECEENSEDDFEILFQGYCKNKSRLKQILQWTKVIK